MEEFKRAWIISYNVEPEIVEIKKRTKMQSKIRMADGVETTFANERLFDDKLSCLKDCINRNYMNLASCAKCCSDTIDRIKKQEAQLDAERSK